MNKVDRLELVKNDWGLKQIIRNDKNIIATPQ